MVFYTNIIIEKFLTNTRKTLTFIFFYNTMQLIQYSENNSMKYIRLF